MATDPIVAVTGASGYVGSIIVEALSSQMKVISLVRAPRTEDDRLWRFEMSVQEMAALLRREAVTHIVHAAWDMKESSFNRVEHTCVEGTKRLVAAAKDAAVSDLIFISTISAFEGARSAYGQSKLRAEKLILAAGGLVLRLGLVYGESGRGLLSRIAALATRLPAMPVIVGGVGNQFLLHEQCLSTTVVRAVRGELRGGSRVVTLAHPDPVSLVELVKAFGSGRRRPLLIIPIPWLMIYMPLRAAEVLGVRLNFRSDSIRSFVYQDPRPDFSSLRYYGITTSPDGFTSRQQS